MGAPGNTVISTSLGVLLLIVLCYVGGRLHQWSRGAVDREEAFRDGYDTATRSLFSVATRLRSEVAATARVATVQKAFEPGVVRAIAPVPVAAPPPAQIEAPRRAARHRADARHGDPLAQTRQEILPAELRSETA